MASPFEKEKRALERQMSGLMHNGTPPNPDPDADILLNRGTTDPETDHNTGAGDPGWEGAGDGQ